LLHDFSEHKHWGYPNESRAAMNYWITTHWPPRKGEERFSNTGAWVQNGKQAVLAEMQPGDMLFIYEHASGKTVLITTAGGRQQRVGRQRGKQGVVALAEITTAPSELPESGYDYYTDGSRAWWRYKADARVINSTGFIPRQGLARLLGYSADYAFKGFGHKNSGVRRLSPEEYNAIHSTFVDSQGDIAFALAGSRSVGPFGGTGEGPIHKSLKEYIAAHPERAFGESGLRTLEIEYPFKTGDKIDVLLQDQDGRLVTVEVEVDCDDTEVAGPLQCMKYRAMIAYLLERRVPEVRTVLAARSMASTIKKRCSDYDIEVLEIPEWPLALNRAKGVDHAPLPASG
jgi:hypothetical protein